jgi:hypothetical protein
MAEPAGSLDREHALRALTHAVRLQYRSALAYTIVAGSLVGFEHLALGPQLGLFAPGRARGLPAPDREDRGARGRAAQDGRRARDPRRPQRHETNGLI